ncbi:Ddx50 [Symbiodinium sp. CCMP2592]|nr:Ddx50 [Symbiodinium sp. CCMP2592]
MRWGRGTSSVEAFRIPFCISFNLRLPIPEILKQKLGSFHFQGSLCLRRLLSWMMFYVIAEARTGPLEGKRRHWMLRAADAEEATKSWTPKSSNERLAWVADVMIDEKQERKSQRVWTSSVKHRNLHGLGVTKLFEIQSRAFDPILRGRSFVGRSKTGTGKTVAYLLPLLERMRHEKMTLPHSLVILVPTRELCKQVGSALLSLSVQVDVALVYGGETLHSQEQLVRLGAVAVVATPGRCARLVERGALQTENVRALVIDEADAMFGPEFVGRVERVLNAVAKPGLQHVLFSASLPDDISTLIGQHFPNHELVDLVDRRGPKGEAVVTAVDHRLCKVPDKRPTARARVLMHLLNEKLDMLGGRCIVFVDTASQATALLAHPAMERRARSLHGNSAAEERDSVLTSFANKEFDVLVATDVIARGLDFADVNLVMQLHPPKDAAQYVHRSGRTGRAGRGGTCITLYDSAERRYVQRVRQVTQHEFSMIAAPGPLDVHHAAVSRLLEQLFGVQPEEYDPLLEDAETLLDENGPAILASAMAVLDSRHADLQQALRDRPSIFSGRRGFVCLLANDPEHLVATTEGEIQRIVGSMMPQLAKVGRVARVEGGWAVDVEHRHASGLIEALRSGSVQAPFEVSVARRMPRVLRGRAGRLTKAPWAAQRRWAMKSGARRREKLAKMTKGFVPIHIYSCSLFSPHLSPRR